MAQSLNKMLQYEAGCSIITFYTPLEVINSWECLLERMGQDIFARKIDQAYKNCGSVGKIVDDVQKRSNLT